MRRPGQGATYDFRVFARAASRSAVAHADESASGVFSERVTHKSVPRLALSQAALLAMPLDHRAGFVLSFVDGAFTVEMILDACPMYRAEAIEILRELATLGVIEFE